MYRERAIGVVLTGGDGDESAGIQAIKRLGGQTIAQSEASSEQPRMPRSAIATGVVDFILPLHEIAAMLVRLVGGEAMQEKEQITSTSKG